MISSEQSENFIQNCKCPIWRRQIRNSVKGLVTQMYLDGDDKEIMTLLFDFVQHLLSVGADCNHPNSEGNTALISASLNGHLEIVQLLVSNHADMEKAYPEEMTPLMMAPIKGHLEIVHLLLAKGADQEKYNKDGRTALFLLPTACALDLCPTEDMRAELEESSGCPVRRRRGRSCACTNSLANSH